jgi:hypothetical protein
MHSPLKNIKVLGEVDVITYVNLFSNIDDRDWMGEFNKFTKHYIPGFQELEILPMLYSLKKTHVTKFRDDYTVEEAASNWSIDNAVDYRTGGGLGEDYVTLKGRLYEKFYDERLLTDIKKLLSDKFGDGTISMFLLNLMNPHSNIEPHVDDTTGNKRRIHIPLVTHPDIKFRNGNDEIHMEVGKVYLFDHEKEHSVINPTDYERIHLIMDWRPND